MAASRTPRSWPVPRHHPTTTMCWCGDGDDDDGDGGGDGGSGRRRAPPGWTKRSFVACFAENWRTARASLVDPARWWSPAMNSRTTRSHLPSGEGNTPRCRRGWRDPLHRRLSRHRDHRSPTRSCPPPPRWCLPLYPCRPRPPIASLVVTSSLRTSSICNVTNENRNG